MMFSATEAAFEGFRLTRRSPLTLLWWAGAYAVFIGVFFAIAGNATFALMRAAEALEGVSDPSPAQLAPIFASYGVVMGVGIPLALLFGAVLNAAVARAVLRPAEKAFGYMRIGADELRVLVVSVVLAILACVMVMIGAVVIGFIGAYGADSGSAGAVAAALILGLLLFLVFIFLAVRFSLALPLVVAERRIAIFDSWGLTRGRFWPLLGMAIIAGLMSIVVSILGSIVVFPVMAAFGMSGGFADLAQMDLAAIMTTMAPFAIVYLIINAILSAMQLAIVYAPFAAAYRDIAGYEEAAPVG